MGREELRPLLGALTKLIGGSNDRAVGKLQPIVDDVNELEASFERLSDAELGAKTSEFRGRLGGREDLGDILPEAFAAAREAAKRTLGQRHFDVQLIGGAVLHEGRIAEMRTGEGKTLVATLPAYLNALSGEGVHVVTVNDYLARRDAQWMGAIYDMLGLTVGVLQHESSYLYDAGGRGDRGMERLRAASRRDAYRADITYGTNNEFGFDYLRDNMVIDLSQRVQRRLAYGIVDEVDNILIDEARTPLIISGPAQETGKEYSQFSRFPRSLSLTEDYTVDEKHKAVSLTGEGVSKIEKLLRVDNLYAPENVRLVHFIENALKGEVLYTRDEEYVVRDGEVVIVDEFTGRLMPGRRYSDGLHQALEAKEHLKVQRESVTYATITLQNYFRMYAKLAGMTGTAATEAEEFWKIYKLDVVEVPTNLPMTRADLTDYIYKDEPSKYEAVVREIGEKHKEGQPVLVGTTDITKSELLSEKLKRRGIPHEVLNAKQHESEAGIVAQAGRPGAVTVATNMAGRGTDIILGGNPEAMEVTSEEWEAGHKKVIELGGLHIIGTERHEARRIDNQLRGRSGRQGDPGSSRFFVAVDDELMRRFGGDKIKSVMDWAGLDEDTPIENKMVGKSVENAQVKVEAYHFDIRKHLVDYDDVVNTHRDVIYKERDKVLHGGDLRENIRSMADQELQGTLERYIGDSQPDQWDAEGLIGELQSIFPLSPRLSDPDSLVQLSREEIEEELLEQAKTRYEAQEEALSPEVMRGFERELMLRVIDSHWVQHLTSMENLRQGIGLYAYGQRDPLVMYKKEGHDQFRNLLDRIQDDIVHTVYHVSPAVGQNGTGRDGRGQNGRGRRPSGGKSVMTKVLGRNTEAVSTGSRKVGRNDPCPCGSGKKYKRCCLA